VERVGALVRDTRLAVTSPKTVEVVVEVERRVNFDVEETGCFEGDPLTTVDVIEARPDFFDAAELLPRLDPKRRSKPSTTNYLVQKSERTFGFLFLQPLPFKDEIICAIRFPHPTLRPWFLCLRVYPLPVHFVHVVLLSGDAYDLPKRLLVILLGHELLRGLRKRLGV